MGLAQYPTAKMTRSHALLHCLSATRVEAWGGRNPGGVRVLLVNPRLLRFLELSGAGRFVEGGTDEDEAHASWMDGWVVREAEEGERRRAM
jgi:hypothetical protein